MKDRVLLIVESPNKIKSLQAFLPSNYVVMASAGHISEIKDGGNYWNTGIDPKNNFETDFAVSPDKKEIVKALKDQVKVASKIIIASDPDREGESIAWSLKKFLNIPTSKCERVTFHEITKSAVLKALENPRKIDEDLVEASHTRMRFDKILGYRLSPIARKQVQARSVGRCQSAGLKLLCDREHEIQEFNSKVYYEIWLHFQKNKTPFKAKYIGTGKDKRDKFDNLDEVNEIINSCEPPFVISNIDTKEKKEYPKAPFITSTLQQEVSSKLHISVKKCTEYAQKLFEGLNVGGNHVALITYIRTDSPEMAPEFVPTLKSYVLANYGKDYYAPLREAKKSDNAQDGHECIRVVDLTMTPEKLDKYLNDKNLVKVYAIIYKRTVASMMKPSITRETTYTIKCKQHLFEFTSREELFDGFKKVYRYDDDKEELVKETFKLEEVIKVKSLESEEKKTKPKPRFNESTFIKELESTGIGRPSTFATILSTLLDESRGYCTKEENYIVPTEKGLTLSKFLDDHFSNLINVNYTSEMENDLDKIAKGEDSLKYLNEFYNNLETTIKNSHLESTSQTTDKVCPECGAFLKLRTGPYGKFYGCSKFPKCKYVEKLKGE